MNVVPAQEAGVASLVLVSPPQAEHGGLPHPTILAAAALLGVDEVWAVGGAQAVALLAYGGTDTDGAELEPVDMVTGPGNVYLTAAKRLLRGLIGIDSEAGTTEIAVLADDTADPVHVAADLISQAEHDPSARLGAGHGTARRSSTRSTPSSRARCRRPSTPSASARRSPARSPAPCSSRDLDDGLTVVDAYAAEHLEIQTRDAARAVAARVRNAGAVFVGPVVAGVARRLLRGLQPRAAHRRLRPALGGAVGADVPARRARDRVHRGRAARGGRPGAHARHRRGPPRARPGRDGAVPP